MEQVWISAVFVCSFGCQYVQSQAESMYSRLGGIRGIRIYQRPSSRSGTAEGWVYNTKEKRKRKQTCQNNKHGKSMINIKS